MPKKKKNSSQTPTLVILVRHGQNDWIKGNKLAGRTPGIHLNAFGRKQAKTVGKYLAKKNIKISAIYASPLERTMETAQILTQKLGDIPVYPCKAIGEVDFGDWTGKSLKKLARQPQWSRVQFSPSQARFPNGESIHEMQTRAVQQINILVHKHYQQKILLVSHADVIKSVVAHYLGMHLDFFQRIVISPASITILGFTPARPMVFVVNETSHLPKQPTSKHTGTTTK